MQLISTAATIISLLMATSADAAALLRRSDAHVADFRSFGKEGCGADNQGIWTVTESQLTGCQTFASASGSDEPVMSVELVDITEGCHCEISFLPLVSIPPLGRWL